MTNIIEADRLSFSYNGSPVLDELTFSIGEGEFIGIIGPNGGGKTTLLRLILGSLAPSQGSLRVFGRAPSAARPFIGYMPQYSTVNDELPLTVAQIVAMGLFDDTGFFPRIPPQKMKTIMSILEMVSLGSLAKRHFSELSGGQRQRTLLARAIVSSPKVLLLDEPTASVDYHVEKDIYEYLKGLSGSMTILLVSHDIGVVSAFADRVMCLKGRAVMHKKSEISGELIAGELYHHDADIITHNCGI